MVTSEGRCPTCWGDTQQPNASGRRRYLIHVDLPTPTLCVVCGEATGRTVAGTDQIAEEAAYDSDEGLPRGAIEFVLHGLIGGLSRLLFRRRSNPSGIVVNELSVTLRQCRHCRKEEVRSLAANHTDRTMIIAAHERFIEEHEAV